MLPSVNMTLVFFNLEELLSLSLSFVIFLMKTGQLFCGMSLNLGLSDAVEFPFCFMSRLLKYECRVEMGLAAGNSFPSPAVWSSCKKTPLCPVLGVSSPSSSSTVVSPPASFVGKSENLLVGSWTYHIVAHIHSVGCSR